MKTPEEIAAEEAATKEHREQLAREANQKRNQAMLDARNEIADRADRVKDEEDDLQDLTDEVWDQQDRPDNKPKTRAERLAEAELTEDEAAARLIRDKEAEEDELDEAREAGADDSRKNDKGEVEYRVEVAGEEKWLTLSQLRAQAGQASDGSDSGQGEPRSAKTAPTRGPTPEQIEADRQAAERKRQEERQARKAKLIDLHTRASMGDEEAIAELADIQADSTRVTPEELERMVDSRVDARVRGTTAFERAVEWFESDAGYARELKAPGFKRKAAEIDARLAKEQPNLTPRERLDLTGKELRRELAEIAKYLGAPAGSTPAPRQEPPNRLARKREASDEVPRAAGRARPQAEPTEVETTAEAIQSLARARGQARPISH